MKEISNVAKIVQPSPIRKMFNLADGMEDVVSFTVGEPDFNTPAHVVDAAVEALRTGTIREVRPSSVWYESRKEFGPDQVGTELPVHKNTGFELLQGPAQFEGEILGGCIDSMYEMFSGWRHADMPDVCKTYSLFPDLDDWRGKILLLESCEEYMPPETYKKALETLKDTGVFDVVSGVLVGKPMDEVYAAEYKKLLAGVIANKELPIVCNLNIGHALPRCILPFGVHARVDAGEQVIRFG